MEIAVGDVVQIDPEHDEVFGGCFMVVTELKPSWAGLQGYVTVPGKGNEGGQAYYRVKVAKVQRIGCAEWVVKREGGENEGDSRHEQDGTGGSGRQ